MTRKNHSLTTVENPGGISNGREMTRLMWVTPLSDLEKSNSMAGGQQGMYLFGGIDQTGKQTDELIWITMDYK